MADEQGSQLNCLAYDGIRSRFSRLGWRADVLTYQVQNALYRTRHCHLFGYEAMTFTGYTRTLILVSQIVVDNVWHLLKRRADEVLPRLKGLWLLNRLRYYECVVRHAKDQTIGI